MKNSVSFTPVPGLSDAVTLRPGREDLFKPADPEKRGKKPRKPDTSYSGRCAEITELLRRAAAANEGELAMEIRYDCTLPSTFWDRIVPVTVWGRIEPFPGCVRRERLLVAYLSPEDMMREKRRRGAHIRCAVVPVRDFLELAGENGFGARFMSEGKRFDLTRSQFPYILRGAARLSRKAAEEPAEPGIG